MKYNYYLIVNKQIIYKIVNKYVYYKLLKYLNTNYARSIEFKTEKELLESVEKGAVKKLTAIDVFELRCNYNI